MLGQAFKDSLSFLLECLPYNYFYFGSSLGQAKPRQLLIAPAMADGEVNAVLELGYADSIDDTHAELLECVAEAIGVAVRSAKYRIRLQELLEIGRESGRERVGQYV